MPALMIRHKVCDYTTWRLIFDQQGDTRRAHGSQGGWVFRNASDLNEIFVVLEWDNHDRARLFANSDDLRDAMLLAGVIDEPDIWVLEETPRLIV